MRPHGKARRSPKYREYAGEAQRRQAGCSVRRMPDDFHHGLLGQGSNRRTAYERTLLARRRTRHWS